MEINLHQYYLVAYQAVLDAAACLGEGELEEIIQGRPDTQVRFWILPGEQLKLGIIEAVWKVLNKYKDDSKNLGSNIKLAQNSWSLIYDQLEDQLNNDKISVGRDGQTIELISLDHF